ncbi:MAG TPA: helix-hairpin-helix domain-containing protein [Bryobacteraceae bacterium]|nr:helix-hairpin-helix domain-containing protein [Bryobacteraceae bacterium]
MRAAPVCLPVSFTFGAWIAFPEDKPKLPDAPGKVTTVKLCGTCHAAEIVMSRRESQEGWSGVVEDMLQRGFRASEDDLGEVKGAPMPKVNVNKTDAAGLVAGLGIQSGHAAAIVNYRQEKGSFKSLADVLKVPGIDASAIEAKEYRLEF